jgi:hypothetical protein
MKPKRQWIKLHQRLLEHPWLNDKPEWLAAWVQILLTASDEGTVDLTAIPVREQMSEKAWRRFVDRLESEGMITGRRRVNLGRRKGNRNVAEIASWTAYQSLALSDENEGRSKGGSKGRSTVASQTGQTPHEGRSKGRSKGGSLYSLEELDTPPTPSSEPLESPGASTIKAKTPAQLSSEEKWMRRQQFAATAAGSHLLGHLGQLAMRTELTELERIAGLWTIPEMKAAWQQAKRDAKHNTNKTYLLILQGHIALDRSLLPETTGPVREWSGPTRGQLVELPDDTIHEVADVDTIGNWVLFEDHGPVRPEACSPVPREAN